MARTSPLHILSSEKKMDFEWKLFSFDRTKYYRGTKYLWEYIMYASHKKWYFFSLHRWKSLKAGRRYRIHLLQMENQRILCTGLIGKLMIFFIFFTFLKFSDVSEAEEKTSSWRQAPRIRGCDALLTSTDEYFFQSICASQMLLLLSGRFSSQSVT